MTELSPVGPPDPDTDPRWRLIKQKANEAKAVRAFRLFRARGIEPILIKGVAATLFYPPEKFRDSFDLDIAVDPSDFESAKELIHSKEAVGLAIDLHSGLRHLDTLPWDDLVAHSVEVTFEEGSVRALCPEDHLRVLSAHWLTDGGADRERLWDIYYGINRRPADFDWDRLLNAAGPRRRRWVECAAGIAAKYLDLDLDGTPLEKAEGRLPSYVTKTVEHEWADETRFRPLRDSMDDLSTFMRQLRKRLPPNPITAVILQGGDLDTRHPVLYQLRSMASRSGQSLLSIAEGVRWRVRGSR